MDMRSPLVIDILPTMSTGHLSLQVYQRIWCKTDSFTAQLASSSQFIKLYVLLVNKSYVGVSKSYVGDINS